MLRKRWWFALASACIVSFCIGYAHGATPHMIGPDGGDVRSLAYDPQNPDRILLGTSSGQIFESRDRGTSWTRFAHLGTGPDYVLDHIIFDPSDSRKLYVAAWSIEHESGELFRSRNSGKSFESLNEMKGKSIRSFAMAPSNSKTLIAGTLDGVFRSDDAGDHWSRISPEGHKDIKNIESIAIDPQNPDVIFAGTTEGLWKTQDSGATWHRVTAPNIIVNDVMIDPRDSTRVMLATDRSGVLLSTNNSASFIASNEGFAHRQVRALLADNKNANVLYAGMVNDKEFGGVYVTRDAGQRWSQLSNGLNGRDVFTLAQDEKGNVYAGTNAGLFRLAQNSRMWTRMTLPGMMPNVPDLALAGN